MSSLSDLASLIRFRRELAGLTQSELQRLSGVSLPMIQLIEAGKTNPSWETVTSLSRVLRLELILRPQSNALEDLALEFGLVNGASPPKKRITRRNLSAWLKQAGMEAKTHRDPRLLDSYRAICVALREHFPSLITPAAKLHRVDDAPIDGRIIKLKRIATARLLEILHA